MDTESNGVSRPPRCSPSSSTCGQIATRPTCLFAPTKTADKTIENLITELPFARDSAFVGPIPKLAASTRSRSGYLRSIF